MLAAGVELLSLVGLNDASVQVQRPKSKVQSKFKCEMTNPSAGRLAVWNWDLGLALAFGIWHLTFRRAIASVRECPGRRDYRPSPLAQVSGGA